jgi:S-adenosylmethionine:tRNA ribosyltransferase-isomerase
MTDHRFHQLSELLRPGDVVVVNQTRVRRARLVGSKADTGGQIEALVLGRDQDNRWELLVKPARRLRRGSRVEFGSMTATLLGDPVDGRAWCRVDADGPVEAAIEAHGRIPLPPYITEDIDDPDRYQTVFADRVGSAAAPTAGLHFTPRVIERLGEREIGLTAVDLEVGLATFRPMGAQTIEEHTMHSERCRIDAAAAAQIEECRERRGRVVAIGTTVVRTLESFGRDDGTVSTGEQSTDLYLRPGSPFRVVDLLVTNFHLPRSSLLVLLSAFMGKEWRSAYRHALDRGYRFLSFGDAMICEREPQTS